MRTLANSYGHAVKVSDLQPLAPEKPEEHLYAYDGPTWSRPDEERSNNKELYAKHFQGEQLPKLGPPRMSMMTESTFDEKPNTRKDAARLEKRFLRAMSVADKFDDGRAGDRDFADTIDQVSGEGREFAKDLLSCCGNADAAFAERTNLLENDGTILSETAWRADKEILATSLYEHRWIDAMSFELAKQVTVGCLEHGRLLEKIRRRSDGVFEKICRLHSDTLWRLDAAAKALEDAKKEAGDLKSQREALVAAFETKHQAELSKVQNERQRERQAEKEAERDRREREHHVGDMVRTLNGLFKDMQQNTEGVVRGDLKDRVAKLQQKLDEAHQELSELRPLKSVRAELTAVNAELRLAREENSQLKDCLEARDAVVAALAEKEAQRLRDDELAAANAPAHEGELAKRAAQKWQQRRNKISEEDKNDDDNPVIISTLCVKCKKALDDAVNIREAIRGAPEAPPPLVCRGYRMLLPAIPNTQQRPHRGVAWVRRSMRSILHALILESALRRGSGEKGSRFPEFVYAFFEPPPAHLAKLDVADRREAIAKADDDRWGLYYGCKMLSRDNDEAKLFWALLDETHGCDFVAFALYCLGTMRKVAGPPLRSQVGAAWESTSQAQLEALIDDMKSTVDTSLNVEDDDDEVVKKEEPPPKRKRWAMLAAQEDLDALALGGQESLWVSLDDAIDATEQVLLQANPKLKKAAVEATRSVAVESDGRVAKWSSEKISSKKTQCVDLALWMRILTHLYREEQAHRKAAVRLMFETALAGTVAAKPPDYGTGREPVVERKHRTEAHEPPPCVDLPQFVSIVRTLWPAISTVDACSMYRKAYDEAQGKVDYEVFLTVAEKTEFFTLSLSLPHYVGGIHEIPLPQSQTKALGALVQIRFRMLTPFLDRLVLSLPDSGAKLRLRACIDELQATIDVTKTASHTAAPFLAYRRLLHVIAGARVLSYELGRDYPEGTGHGGFAHRLLTNEISPSDFVHSYAFRELRFSELVALDLEPPPHWAAVENIQHTLAVGKVRLAWRRRMDREVGPPPGIRLRMRRGYLGGRGDVRFRRIYQSPTFVLGAISLLYEEFLLFGDVNEALDAFTHAAYLARFGIPSIAERALHDLFLNCRHLSGLLPRARIFCLLTGILRLPPRGDPLFTTVEEEEEVVEVPATKDDDDDDDDDEQGKDVSSSSAVVEKPPVLTMTACEVDDLEAVLVEHAKEARRFYLEAILVVRAVLRRDEGGPLFLATATTGHGTSECDFWDAPVAALEDAVHRLFDNILETDRVEIILGQIQDLRRGDFVDVDAFLVDIVMRNWARALRDHRCLARDVSAASSKILKGGAETALQSVPGFVKLANAVSPSPEDEPTEDRRLKAALRRYKRDRQLTRAFATAVVRLEGGHGDRLPRHDACDLGLTSILVNDLNADGCASFATKPNLIFGHRASTAHLFAVWDAYKRPIDAFLDKFELQFTKGPPSDALEDTRELMHSTLQTIEKFRQQYGSRPEDEDEAQTNDPIRHFRRLDDLWLSLRDLFDAVNNLRGIQVKYTQRRLDDKLLEPQDIDDDIDRKDLILVPGWDNSWDFLRDSWSALAPDVVLPKRRDC